MIEQNRIAFKNNKNDEEDINDCDDDDDDFKDDNEDGDRGSGQRCKVSPEAPAISEQPG